MAIRRSTLLQSYDYAKAICPQLKMKGRWGLIFIDGNEAGLVQILEAGLLRNLVHALIIDRGPLWFEGYGTAEHFDAFMATLVKQFPRRIGRRYRLIPEIQEGSTVRVQLARCGFKAQEGTPYQTIWIDLTQSLEDLRSRLKKNWRNMLSRAEGMDIDIVWHQDAQALKRLLERYAADKIQKGYDGASVKTIVALAKTMLPHGRMLIGHAVKDGKEVASVLLLLHGRGATYQIGWTSGTGRDCGAQNLLLWDALGVLKQKGVLDFDLGGINDESAKGVKIFKTGMGGSTVALSGLYR